MCQCQVSLLAIGRFSSYRFHWLLALVASLRTSYCIILWLAWKRYRLIRFLLMNRDVDEWFQRKSEPLQRTVNQENPPAVKNCQRWRGKQQNRKRERKRSKWIKKSNCDDGISGAKLWFISLIQSAITARIDQRKEPTTNFLRFHLFVFFFLVLSYLIWFVYFFHRLFPPIAILPFLRWLVPLDIIAVYGFLLCFSVSHFEGRIAITLLRFIFQWTGSYFNKISFEGFHLKTAVKKSRLSWFDLN